MPNRVYSRTFQKAAEFSGGLKKLARQLRVPVADLEKWIAGNGAPPLPIFLKAIDLVLDETAPPAASEPPEPAPPRDCAAAGPSSMML